MHKKEFDIPGTKEGFSKKSSRIRPTEKPIKRFS